MAEVPFLPVKQMRTSYVDKLKMNDDHSLIAFTIDIGNTERCTAGVKCMATGEIRRDLKLENVS